MKIRLKHFNWERDFSFLTPERGSAGNDFSATVYHFDKNVIRLNWDIYGKETFCRDDVEGQNIYWFSGVRGQLVLDSQELLIHPHEGESSPLSNLPYQKIFIRFNSYNFFYYWNCILEEIKDKIKELPALKRILFFGGCKEVVFATYLAVGIRKYFPDLKIGVIGSPIPIDFSDSEMLAKYPSYSPSINAFLKNQIFKDLLKRGGMC